MTTVAAIIVAAGRGKRFGAAKQFAMLRGKTVLDWSLAAFNAHEKVGEMILVLPDPDDAQKNLYAAKYGKITAVVKGGEQRQDSVRNGFRQVAAARTRIVLVHDAVRPLVAAGLISRVIDKAEETGAAVPVIPLEDTAKKVADAVVVSTLDRDGIRRVQTPQGFSYDILRLALERAVEEGFYGTDEAALVERQGIRIAAVEGDVRNIKVTTATDLRIAGVLCGE